MTKTGSPSIESPLQLPRSRSRARAGSRARGCRRSGPGPGAGEDPVGAVEHGRHPRRRHRVGEQQGAQALDRQFQRQQVQDLARARPQDRRDDAEARRLGGSARSRSETTARRPSRAARSAPSRRPAPASGSPARTVPSGARSSASRPVRRLSDAVCAGRPRGRRAGASRRGRGSPGWRPARRRPGRGWRRPPGPGCRPRVRDAGATPSRTATAAPRRRPGSAR